MTGLLLAALIALALARPAPAQPFTALARAEAGGSTARTGGGVEVTLALSRGVPYRLTLSRAPPHLVAEFFEVDWAGLDAARFAAPAGIAGARLVPSPGGERGARLELTFARPLVIDSAGLETGARSPPARLTLRLAPADPAGFAAAVTDSDTAGNMPEGQALPPAAPAGGDTLTVAIDPGHGGIDPGAEAGGEVEAALMLTVARELAEALRRAGLEVVLTRRGDEWVGLEERLSIARAGGADLFLSLHADSLPEGRASGVAFYTFARSAGEEAARLLAARHGRDELLSGLDLSRQDDRLAGVLMDLARAETAPRSDALADALAGAFRARDLGLYKRPLLEGALAVLKAPDIPSVLIELGFLSTPADRARLTDTSWRARAVAAIRGGVLDWRRADAARVPLLRR